MNDVPLIPYILDVSVLAAIAGADPELISFIQILDGRGQPLVIPGLAITGASLDTHDEDADDLLAGLELLEHATIAPLHGAQQAARLAAVIVHPCRPGPVGRPCRHRRRCCRLSYPHPQHGQVAATRRSARPTIADH
ncbi:MAG: hypothetical protein ACRDNF_01545 [Streptosporangiaceae bacterium]